MTKWLIRLSQSLYPNVHKGIPKHHVKFHQNWISNDGDIEFYRKIGLVWFGFLWFRTLSCGWRSSMSNLKTIGLEMVEI